MERSFRVALGCIFVCSIAVAGYHRVQANSREPISRRDEGLVLAVLLRSSGLLLALAALAYLLAPSLVAWASLPLPEWVRWGGFLSGLVGVFLTAWTLGSLGKNLTDTVVTREDATLVTHGPYRWVRHPYYCVTALLAISTAVVAANWLIGLLGALVTTLLVIRTPKEEAKLIERFGQEYRAYMATTGGFFPRCFRARRSLDDRRG